jgi:hypothetical protein
MSHQEVYKVRDLRTLEMQSPGTGPGDTELVERYVFMQAVRGEEEVCVSVNLRSWFDVILVPVMRAVVQIR